MRTRAVRVLAVGVVAAGVALAVQLTDVLQRLEADLVDQRFELRNPEKPRDDIVIVGIDENSIGELGQFPFSRKLHARAMDRLREAAAKEIVYDVQFSEPSDDPAADDAVLAAAQRSRALLGTSEVFEDNFEPALMWPAAEVRRGGAEIGNVDFPVESDGVIRKVPRQVSRVEHLSQLAARRLGGKPRRGRIDFAGPTETFRTIPFADLVEGRVEPAELRGKIVIVGATATNLQDYHATSGSGEGEIPGAEVHANAIATILDGFPLGDVGPVGDLLLILAFAFVAPVATLPGRAAWAPWRALVAGGLGAVVLALGAYGLFVAGVVVPVVIPALALLLGTAGAFALTYATEVRARRRVRATFERFVPAAVVGELLDEERVDAETGIAPRELPATVLFCDLRGFTTLAEGLSAEQTIAVLNRWLREVSAAVLDREGTVVSFQGDGVMAVFGAPVPRADHAARAVAAAGELLSVRLPAFNAWLAEEGITADGVRIGIGVNSGTVMSGSVGSERRLEYAAVGDATNVAARLQALSKEDPDGRQLFVADSTASQVGEDAGLTDYGPVELRGRREPVRVWTR